MVNYGKLWQTMANYGNQEQTHGLLILFLRLSQETRVPPVPSEGFDIVEVGNDVLKKFGWANF